MKITKKLVTPELAKNYLVKNLRNRKLNKKIVSKYSSDIKKGNWKEDTGELVKIATNGDLIDGQHRLSAIVEADKAIFLHIAYDVDSSVFDVLDTGKGRSASDVFEIQGVNYSTQLPSIISTFLRLEKGNYPNREGFTNQRLYCEYVSNSDYWNALAKKTHTLYKSFSKILPPSLIGGIFAHLDKTENGCLQNDFISQLCTGADISNNTMYVIRNVLISDKMKSRNRLNNSDKVSLIIRAWNAFICEKQLKRLVVTGAKFPTTKLAVPE